MEVTRPSIPVAIIDILYPNEEMNLPTKIAPRQSAIPQRTIIEHIFLFTNIESFIHSEFNLNFKNTGITDKGKA